MSFIYNRVSINVSISKHMRAIVLDDDSFRAVYLQPMVFRHTI